MTLNNYKKTKIVGGILCDRMNPIRLMVFGAIMVALVKNNIFEIKKKKR